MKSLVIKNSHLAKTIDLLDIPLHGSDARARNRFVTLLGTKLVALNQERQKILDNYCKKDKDGKPKLIENNTKYDFTPVNLEKANNELTELYSEDCIIDILPSNEEDIKIATDTILKTSKTFNITEGAIYDEIAKSFEQCQKNQIES
jgi:hypothetical protein